MSARVGNQFRPQLEALDGRVVPAQFTWTGMYGTDAADTQNWLKAFEETPEWTEPYHPLPADGDDVAVGPGPFGVGSVDCVGLQVFGGGAFRSLYVGGGYTGTATFGAAIATGQFTLTAGAISQPTAGTDLTVTNTFTWTGGTLNSALSGANVFLAGAAGTIDPGAGNSITSGSTLILNPRNGIGATLTFEPGQLNLDAGRGLEANELCRVNVNAGDDQAASVTTKGKPEKGKFNFTFNKDSSLNVSRRLAQEDGLGVWNGENLVLVNKGGHVTFSVNTRSTFGRADLDPDEAFIQQLSGTFEIENGATVAAPEQTGAAKPFMALVGGTLLVRGVNGGVGLLGHFARLDGKLEFTGGQIAFAGNYTTFSVTEDVTWTKGVFSPRLDVTDETKHDSWSIYGKLFIFDSTAVQVQPVTINYQPPPGGTAIDPAFRWEVLSFGSVQLPPNADPPKLGTTPGNAEMEWRTSVVAGKTRWKLRAKQ